MQINQQIVAVAPRKRFLLRAMAIIAAAAIALSGCNNSSPTAESESTGMNNTTNIAEFSAELNDPSDAISELEFLSAEDDAIYQCLLSEATQSATDRGMQAYPVRTQELHEHQIYQVGVYANWCKTAGTGDAVDADISACRNLNGGFSAPGTEVLQLIAAPISSIGIGDTIRRIELKSFKIPEQGSVDFKVEYRVIRGGGENFFNLSFFTL